MNKKKITEQILSIISTAEDTLQLRREPFIQHNYDILKRNMSRVASSFSNSWLGYHANIYYKGFGAPDTGDSFNTEWGFMSPYGRRATSGWNEVTYEQVQSEVMKSVDSNYESAVDLLSDAAMGVFDKAHSNLSILLAVLLESKSTRMLEDLNKRVSDIKRYISSHEIIGRMRPKGTLMSRDSKAFSQGNRTPPHVAIEAAFMSKFSAVEALSDLSKEANKLHRYMELADLIEYSSGNVNPKIFIGHGHSPLWRELKDFISGRLSLEWDEFNREPVAGLATKERMQSMMEQACFAFLLMTSEDQHGDDTMHARENVVHEVGLFQGKLGFRKAIVLLEDGCAEFSNISGLSQIRFPKGNISNSFEDIRRVLEREGILKK